MLRRVRDARFAEGLACVHCGSVHVVRWGMFRDRQRYRCRACRRTFSDLTLTPFAYSKLLDRWPGYLQLMRGQTTLRRAAASLDIHLSTSFRWRHRYLESVRVLDRVPVTGLVEFHELLLPYSSKGQRVERSPPGSLVERSAEWRRLVSARVRVLIACGRQGAMAALVAVSDMPSTPLLQQLLRDRVRAATLIVTFGPFHPYAIAARTCGVALRRISHAEAADRSSLWHLQSVRSYTSRFRRWLVPFRGVATRYLANYLAWHRLADPEQGDPWLDWFVARAVRSAAAVHTSREHGGCSHAGERPAAGSGLGRWARRRGRHGRMGRYGLDRDSPGWV